ncbi:hypothetical protein F4556_005198 [Kitasatospora gansuensis]|uniref:Uncharacterized protein n=1 Tax=Kitasatospora gansuensis TaxID=258050 RepID=A0A7W7WJY3_9ACTN|nr:hypothetical protein [Kitasatospora gansuensis]
MIAYLMGGPHRYRQGGVRDDQFALWLFSPR